MFWGFPWNKEVRHMIKEGYSEWARRPQSSAENRSRKGVDDKKKQGDLL